MTYQLKRKESVADGIRRIAGEEMARGEAELLDPDMDPQKAVHAVRKRLKKLRALLRLVQPRMPEAVFREQNRRFRDLGRALSGARDADVVLATLESIRADLLPADSAPATPPFARLYDHLREHRDARHADAGQLKAQKKEVAEALRSARDASAGWPLQGRGFDLLAPGLEQTYRRGRKALAVAIPESADEPWHDWRKRAKEHWYHTRLLTKTWPKLMQCRARALEDLSDLLGDDHDMAVLRTTIDSLPEGVMEDHEVERLQRLIRERQNRLRQRAIALGRRLYTEKPNPLRKRIHGYWNVWRN
jgi:CHAD domain-containing protein